MWSKGVHQKVWGNPFYFKKVSLIFFIEPHLLLGMLKVDNKIGNNLQEFMASIKWNLWRGKVGEAFQKAEEIEDYLQEYKEDKEQNHKYEKLKVFDNYADEFRAYISNNRHFIVNNSDRYGVHQKVWGKIFFMYVVEKLASSTSILETILILNCV